MDKYLKSPGTLSISKALHDIYKSLDLEGFREADESHTMTNRSEAGPTESEPENANNPIRDFIIRRNNRAFEFEPITKVATGLTPAQDRAKNLYGYVQVLLHQQAERE